jgi:predicted exporter
MAFVTFTRVVTVRADMADFLPPGETPAARLLIDELRSGAAASLLLVGIEGAPAEDLARISGSLAEGLRASGLFLVGNGSEGFAEEAQAFLFAHRYLLSSATKPEAFTVQNLRARLHSLLEQLTGSAAPLAKRIGFADPIGAAAELLQVWAGESRVEQREGVWFAAGSDRALLLARSTASSLDYTAGRAALDAVNDAFAQAKPGRARLLVSGPGVFAVSSAEAIRGDVHLISVLSGTLVVAFLLWRHRSVYVVAAAAVPLLAGVVAGALAVQFAHGFVHALALGFGLTMLGVAADYPLLLIGQRAEEESTSTAARRIWPTMLLAAGAAALGLVAMLLSSFPGLSQLGLFSAVGLAVAAVATRWVLPILVEDVAFRGQQVTTGWLRAAAALRARRAWLLLPALFAGAWLAIAGMPAWERDLENLSPVPQQARDLDEELRRQLGAPDVRHLIAITGSDAEEVLQRSERLDGVVAELRDRDAIGGADLPSRYLPSKRTQLERQAALPTEIELRARLTEAMAGLPFRPEAFSPFVKDVGTTRGTGPLTPTDFAAVPVLAARLDPLLFERDGAWHGLVALTDVRTPDDVRTAVAGLGEPAIAYIDLKAETEGIVGGYTREALAWLGLGGLLLLALLVIALRDLGLVLRVAAPIVCAVLVTLALLDVLAIRLTLFHLAALLLMMGVSIDYGLFLNQADRAGESRALGSVLNCNATTLLTFGLLAFCRNPVLQGIGITVASGVLVAVVFAVGLSRPSDEAS